MRVRVMPSNLWIIAVFVVCLSAARGNTDDIAPPRFTVETLADSRIDCTPISLSDDGSLRVGDASGAVTLTGLIEMRQSNHLLPPLPALNFVLFTNGDRLPVDAESAAKLEENRLFVWPAKSLGKAHETGLGLYLPQVVFVFWAIPAAVDDAELFYARLVGETRKRDVAYLRNGDRIEGTLTALSGKSGCVMTTDRHIIHTPWSQLAGIAWNTERQSRPRAKKAYYHAVLDGGARLSFTELRLAEKSSQWHGKTQAGPMLDIPLASMLALDRRLGPAVYLSDLTPARYEPRPYLGITWPLIKDAAATGHPLRIGGNTYDKGLGLHAPCRVVYELDGKYDRFEGVVGFDESIARRGRARLAVQLDGKRIDLNGGKELTCLDAPLPVQMDLRGVRTLTLIVDLGALGDVQAHVNWANARLIKQAK